MRPFIIAGVWLALLVPLAGQRHKLTDINTETPEGAMLAQIGQEADAAKKTELMEQFVEKFPKHQGAAWVLSQLQPAYLKTGDADKAMAAGEKLLAIDPEDVEVAHSCLKAAETKKDPDAIKKWAVRTSEIARKVVASPQPKEADEVEEWKRRVDFSKQVGTYTEYSLFANGMQQQDARKRIELLEALLQINPDSQYVPQMMNLYFVSLSQVDRAKAAAVAEKALEKDPQNEDMLLAVANHYYEGKRDLAKAQKYADQLISVLPAKPAPQGVGAADWDKKKNLILGISYWMTGVLASNSKNWPLADKNLREALPRIEQDRNLTAEALFHLGLANYQMGDKGDSKKIIDAVNFNAKCAAIPSPFQAQARKNLAAIRSQYHIK